MGTKRHECIGEGCIRCQKTLYAREWRKNNPEKLKLHAKHYNKEYYEANKERIKKETKEYYEANKDKVNITKKAYYEKNFAKVQEYQKEYWLKNKHILEPRYEARILANKEKYHKAYMIYKKKKYHTNENYRLKEQISARIRAALKHNYKSASTMQLIGCSIEELKIHLEKQFTEGMTWENHGIVGWHIDHIIPCDSFDLTNEEEQKKCFHWTNLQPLWYPDNLEKSNKIF